MRPILYNSIRASAISLMLITSAQAYDVTDKFSIGGVLSGAGQCQILSDDADSSDKCRGAVPVQPELSFRPTDNDEIFIKFGFAAENGLNSSDNRNRSPFILATWAADLEDDVKDINGRDRDYLLTAWYKYSFQFENDSSLGATFGIIDSTDYLDENAYANDEFTQFMNEVFVNSAQSFLPSYDTGGVLAWESESWYIRGVGMNIGENDDGNQYNFFGATLAYTPDTAWGEGNYRVTVSTTSEDFLDNDGVEEENLLAVALSFDQQLGEHLGAFLRFGWQDDDAAVDYDTLYSGGLDVNGGLWNRTDDNVGIGFAYLDGGNLDVDKTYVFETYYRAIITDHLAITADAQWMKDDLDTGGDDPEGWILSLRATAEF